MAACSKDGINPVNSSLKPNGGNALPSGNYCGTVINVAAPDGIDDDQKLLDAFTAAKLAGPGSVVQLAEGTYRVGFIEIRDFFGSFVGAGKGKSIITFKTDLDCSGFYPNDMKNWHIFIKFIGGDIYMADMTLTTPEEKICRDGSGAAFKGAAMGQIIFSSLSANGDPEIPYIKVWVNNVDFIGKKVSWGPGYNFIGALYCAHNGAKPIKEPRGRGDIKVTNCSFDTFLETTIFGWLSGSKIIVGEKNNGNLFKNCMTGVVFRDNIDDDFKVTGNKFYLEGQFGIMFNNGFWGATTDDPQTRRTTIDIQQNEFNIKKKVVNNTWTNGIIIQDPRRWKGENLPVAVLIKNNLFKFTEEGFRGILLASTRDAVIRNNKFTGDGYEGILSTYGIINNVLLDNGNGLVLGNNFSGSKFSLASIRLLPNTNNWSIVGGGSSNETILNFGTNNLITGVNIKDSDVPLGETIKDNMDMINDMFRVIKKSDSPF
ncbi:MAG TPA: hypothetical protein DDW27_00335 [Bacteroidales bacterium]|nr:hypothetical protein [Bacteroidales bacterium]